MTYFPITAGPRSRLGLARLRAVRQAEDERPDDHGRVTQDGGQLAAQRVVVVGDAELPQRGAEVEVDLLVRHRVPVELEDQAHLEVHLPPGGRQAAPWPEVRADEAPL